MADQHQLDGSNREHLLGAIPRRAASLSLEARRVAMPLVRVVARRDVSERALSRRLQPRVQEALRRPALHREADVDGRDDAREHGRRRARACRPDDRDGALASQE